MLLKNKQDKAARSSQVALVVKNPPVNAGEWQSTPVFLPGESHGQRSPMGYSPWDANSRT